MQIYKITNLLNGKFYIGQDSKNDKFYFGSGKIIKRSIEKNGKEYFKKEILSDEIDSKYELDEMEKLWIQFYDSTNSKKGYNICFGGGGGLGCIRSEETRIKISNSHKGKKLSKERIEKMSNYMRGNQFSKGYKHSEETRKKVSLSLIGNKRTLGYKHSEEFKKACSERICSEETKLKMTRNSKKSKKILKISIDNSFTEEFDSIRQACKNTKSNKGSLTNALNNKKIFKDCYWTYIIK